MRCRQVVLSKGVDEGKILFLSLIAAPEGIHMVCRKFPRVKVITSEIDEGIDESTFQVVPGESSTMCLLGCIRGCVVNPVGVWRNVNLLLEGSECCLPLESAIYDVWAPAANYHVLHLLGGSPAQRCKSRYRMMIFHLFSVQGLASLATCISAIKARSQE